MNNSKKITDLRSLYIEEMDQKYKQYFEIGYVSSWLQYESTVNIFMFRFDLCAL